MPAAPTDVSMGRVARLAHTCAPGGLRRATWPTTLTDRVCKRCGLACGRSLAHSHHVGRFRYSRVSFSMVNRRCSASASWCIRLVCLLLFHIGSVVSDPPPPPSPPSPLTPPQMPAPPSSPPAPRVIAQGRTLLRDSQPYLIRGGIRQGLEPSQQLDSRPSLTLVCACIMSAVAYSPTPIGVAPSGSQSLDFFSDEYAHIFERDLPRMAAIGINTIRIYTFDSSKSHARFLDACHVHGISVIAGFELDAQHDDLKDTVIGLPTVELHLKKALASINASHPAMLMWMVGNELNLPSAGFICDDTGDDACNFKGSELPQLFGAVNQLCAAVHIHGLLCSTPLADYRIPAGYSAEAHADREGATRWFPELDAIMPNVDVWTVNKYGDVTGATSPPSRPIHSCGIRTVTGQASFCSDARVACAQGALVTGSILSNIVPAQTHDHSSSASTASMPSTPPPCMRTHRRSR